MLLELRFETLWDHVDYFVISEAVYTQVGNPKPLNFDINKFSKYREKIRYLVVDHFPEGPMDFWKNENYQRNYLINGLFDAKEQDWILVSDLDEIPRPEVINQFNPSRYKRADFEQCAYVYRLNNLSVLPNDQPAFWPGSKITTFYCLKDFFKTVTAVRSYKSQGIFRSLHRALFKKFHTQTIRNGGWHFTWMFTLENLILKMENIAEQAGNRQELKNPDYISHQINNGLDIVNPESRYLAQDVSLPQFPKHLVDHKIKYSEWFR
jgi:beta-1,4-mannosyl-glycoprotein beta-1,4-N-acetylglucosaminyltransferase